MRQLSHPIALVALAVWIVNDQMLKRAWPSVVTGKLSDIAGMIVAPLALAAAIAIAPRVRGARSLPWIAFAIVGTCFTLTKTWIPANEAFTSTLALVRAPMRVLLEHAHGVSFREELVLVRDPTDLVALPFGLVAVHLWRAGPPEHRSSAFRSRPSERRSSTSKTDGAA
jgi:hypothetical protein